MIGCVIFTSEADDDIAEACTLDLPDARASNFSVKVIVLRE
jgi:hypothetical protein